MTEKKFKTIDIESKDNLAINFLYKTLLGRLILKVLIRPSISKIFGKIMDSKFSTIYIKHFISKNKIDTSFYKIKNYSSFNDFFKREKKEEFLNFSKDKNTLTSPCDAKLSAYKISEKNIFKIKNLEYDLKSLIQEKTLLDEFKNGSILVFRLAPDNYHRYHFIDDGKIIFSKKIKGVLHTVRPVAFKNHRVFLENQREVSLLFTENFKKIIQIEVGALFVGRIKNHNVTEFKRGMEKGYFEFGGSTIILILKEEIKVLECFFENTKNNKETIIETADKIGYI